MMSATKRNESGFTLVELVVASTLMTIVLAGVYVTFSTAIGSWRSAEVNYQTYEDARRAMGMLSRELRAIPGNARHLMNGGEDWVEFIALTQPMQVDSGRGAQLMLVKYRVAPRRDGLGEELVREEALLEGPLTEAWTVEENVRPPEIALGRTYEFVVASDVEAMSIRYLWTKKEERPSSLPPDWVEPIVDTMVEFAQPEALVVSLSLFDPGKGANGGMVTFRNSVAFRGGASAVPKHLLPKGKG